MCTVALLVLNGASNAQWRFLHNGDSGATMAILMPKALTL